MNHTLEVKDSNFGAVAKTDIPKLGAMQIHKMAGDILNVVEGFQIGNIEKLTVLSAAKAIIEAMTLSDDYKSIIEETRR